MCYTVLVAHCVSATLDAVARAAIARVNGRDLVRAALATETTAHEIDHVWAAGKAAEAMAQGALDVLGARLRSVLVVRKASAVPSALDGDARVRLFDAAHPVPDERSQRAGLALYDAACALAPDARALFLLSGGASSLTAAPVEGVTLEQLAGRTRALVRSGASIGEINAVRRRLTRLSGGKLAQTCRGALTVLALSDVPGDDPAVIGSGPASPDPAQPVDARAFQRVSYRILANARTLRDAGAEALRAAGFRPRIREPLVEGTVEALVEEIAGVARALQPGEAWVASGEPTIFVSGPGLGGRAQHLALTVARALDGCSNLAFVACGSDGSDGPTDAAGGCVDGETWRRATAAGLSPEQALARFDSHPLLTRLGATVVTGTTGTNLNDLFLVARGA